MRISLVLFVLGIGSLQSEEVELPPQLRTLQKNYDAAVERATRPLTATYLQELEKLKLDYGRRGQPKLALVVESVIEELKKRPEDPAEDDSQAKELNLAKMSLRQFEDWLATVAIVELEGPYKVRFFYDGDAILSTRSDRPGEVRTHEDAKIEVGLLTIPFTSTDATVEIASDMGSAKVKYSTSDEPYQAKVVPKN